LYAFGGLSASVAVCVYLRSHWQDMPWQTKAFSIFAAVNFASDALSRAWFASWRMTGKPPGMVDHWLVDAVTYSAALAVWGAFWFWTRHRFGDGKPIAIGIAFALLAGIIAHI